MATEPRILRNDTESRDTTRPPLTSREIDRHERILAMGQIVMANHGSENITSRNLAIALGIAPVTLRRHFPDMHALLNEILTRHLLALANAIGEIPLNTPNRPFLQRQAYLEFTRCAFGGLTEAHLLLTRDTHLLPPDLRSNIELTRETIGDILAGPTAGREALILLDAGYLTPDRIETMLAPILPPSHAAPAQPPKPLPKQPAAQPAPKSPAPSLAPPTPHPPDPILEKPGDWIFTSGIPTTARAPPP